MPVYLGVLGPRMLALAGRIADGVVLNLMSPAQAGQAADIARAAGDLGTPRDLRSGRGHLAQNGAEVELHAAMYLQVRDGHITRIEEYLDSARRSDIRKARETLSG